MIANPPMTIENITFVCTSDEHGRQRWTSQPEGSFVLVRMHPEGPWWFAEIDGGMLGGPGNATPEAAFKVLKRHVKHMRNRYDELWDLFEA